MTLGELLLDVGVHRSALGQEVILRFNQNNRNFLFRNLNLCHTLLLSYYIAFGRNNTICGMKIQIKSTIMIAAKNHIEPAKISLTVIPSMPSIPYRDDLTVNTFMPNGGVIIPVSIAMIITRPNHTKSQPKSAIIGHIRGVVKSRIEVESRIHPSTIRIRINN